MRSRKAPGEPQHLKWLVLQQNGGIQTLPVGHDRPIQLGQAGKALNCWVQVLTL